MFKWYLIRERVRVALLCMPALFLILCAAAVWFVPWFLRFPITPVPPFPSVVDGQHVTWVPDPEIRKYGWLDPNSVERIVLYGYGSYTCEGTVTIQSKPAIARFLKAFRTAVKRDAPAAWDPTPGYYVPDFVEISFHPAPDAPHETQSFKFASDSYEGVVTGHPVGTISPEFQDAMRTVGIPPQRETNWFKRDLRNLVWKYTIY